MRNATQHHPQNSDDTTSCPIAWCTTDPAEHAWDAGHDEWLIHRSAAVEVADPIDEQPPAQIWWTSATEVDGTEIEPPQLHVDIDNGSDALSIEQAEALAAALMDMVSTYRAGGTS